MALLIILIQEPIQEVLLHMDLMDQQQRNSPTIHIQERLQEVHQSLHRMARQGQARHIILIPALLHRAIRLRMHPDNTDLLLIIMDTVPLLRLLIQQTITDRQRPPRKILTEPRLQERVVPMEAGQ